MQGDRQSVGWQASTKGQSSQLTPEMSGHRLRSNPHKRGPAWHAFIIPDPAWTGRMLPQFDSSYMTPAKRCLQPVNSTRPRYIHLISGGYSGKTFRDIIEDRCTEENGKGRGAVAMRGKKTGRGLNIFSLCLRMHLLYFPAPLFISFPPLYL